jgi:hypothetical protein
MITPTTLKFDGRHPSVSDFVYYDATIAIGAGYLRWLADRDVRPRLLGVAIIRMPTVKFLFYTS